MENRKTSVWPFVYEGYYFLIVLVIHVFCLRTLQQFDFYGVIGFRTQAFFLSALPSLFLYFVLRAFFRPLGAVFLSGSIEVILSFAHSTKVHHLYEALNFSDIFQVTRLSIVLQYLSAIHLSVLTFAIVSCCIMFLFEKKLSKNLSTFRFFYLSMAVFLSPTLFAPWVQFSDHILAQRLKKFAVEHEMMISAPNSVKDVTLNGLAYHLIKSSYQKKPKPLNQTQQAAFKGLLKENPLSIVRPRKIVFILCESCWKDNNNFVTPFQPLLKRGFTEFRSISPVYGGSTPSAEFEVLTGLPARTDSLEGIIFQEYAAEIKKESHTLPNYMFKLGYETVALHNYDRYFWNRHIVNPKFGFQNFKGLQDMIYVGPNWPPDSILYQEGLDIFKAKKKDKLFMYLMTMYTHGPYENRDDDGVSDYRERLSVALDDLIKFVDSVLEIDPDTLILVFGDHKPALSQFFVSSGVISARNLENYRPWDPIGEVPVFIRHPNKEKIDQVVRKASGLPLFCMIQSVDQAFFKSGVPAFEFTKANNLCSSFNKKEYSFYKDVYPSWLFSESLFDLKREVSATFLKIF